MSQFLRFTLPVSHLDEAARFYRGLLGDPGERISPAWHYFEIKGFALACHDARAEGAAPVPPLRAPLFIAVDEMLAQVRARALSLGARDIDAEIRTLPTREQGFMLSDPFGNALCIVHASSIQRHAPARPAAGHSARKNHVLLFEQEFLNAVKGGELARVRELMMMDPELSHACDASGTSALLLAAYKRHARIVDYLRPFRDDLSIWEAAAIGDVARLATLLDLDPSLIDCPAHDGYLPLGLACFFGQAECVSLLIKRGADVNAISRNAMLLRPLHSAVTCDDADKAALIVRLLLRAGAQVDAVQERGYTPLHRAADRGTLELVELLMRAGADPRIRADNRRTPAQLASLKAHQDVVEALGGV